MTLTTSNSLVTFEGTVSSGLWFTVASQVIQWVKNPPAMQETQKTWVRSLGGEDPLENDMATHPSILAWDNLMDRGA